MSRNESVNREVIFNTKRIAWLKIVICSVPFMILYLNCFCKSYCKIKCFIGNRARRLFAINKLSIVTYDNMLASLINRNQMKNCSS